ncbi:MAG: methyltransferase domain-containing protein [Gemmatimonadota bacterium]|nr:MAG: methyltransferase domain-containing protein [Gemmatimonadota bacterium]
MLPDSWTPERFEQVADYWADRLILESAALDIYGQLVEEPLGALELASRLRLEPGATQLFLDALVALDLLVKDGRKYSNGEAAARYLVPGAPDYLGHRLIAAQQNWELWGRLPTGLRTGKRQRQKRIFLEEPEAARHALLSLHASARSRAADILDRGSIDLKERRQMLDLGGGAGTYSVAFCRAYKDLRATLVDRPIAAAIARDVVASAGLEGRITVLEYDVDERELPSDYDFIWMSNVIHSRSYNANRALLERLYNRLKPGGEIAIQDMIMDETRTRPARGAVLSLHMLLSNGVGRCYTFQDIQTWLAGAGFSDAHWLSDDDDGLTIVTATK